MDFSEALKIVKQGRGIRRGEEETDATKAIYLDKGDLVGSGKVCEPFLVAFVTRYIPHFAEPTDRNNLLHEYHIIPWVPTNEDLLATDWVEHFGHD